MAPVVPLRAAFALPRRSVTPSCSPGCAVIENWFTRSGLSVGRVKTSARGSFAFAGVAATSPRMLLTVCMWGRERNVPNLKFNDFSLQLRLRRSSEICTNFEGKSGKFHTGIRNYYSAKYFLFYSLNWEFLCVLFFSCESKCLFLRK